MNDPENYVTIRDLAKTLGMDRSHVFRYLKRLDIGTTRIRTAESGNQLVAAVSTEEAAYVVSRRSEDGYSLKGKPENPLVNTHGYFYVIQLVPDLDPKRVKLGFAAVVNDRLQEHRTSAPTAELVRCWPCRRVWEQTIIAVLTSKDCRLILNESFECDDLDALLERGDTLFGFLPNPDERIPLADCSPLKKS